MKKIFINPEIGFVISVPENSIMSDVLLMSVDKENVDYGNKAFRDDRIAEEYNMWKGFSE